MTIYRRTNQDGIALLAIMLIVALVTILATYMVERLQLNLARTENIKSNNQAYWYAAGAEEYAKKSLETLKRLNPSTINPTQPWAQDFNFPFDGGGIEATLTDMQSCFNLNSLSDREEDDDDETNTPPANAATNNDTLSKINTPLLAFQRLLSLMDVDEIDNFTVNTVSDSLADWLDSDIEIRPYGAEDGDYESLVFPYSAANTLMTNESEFRLVNGVEFSWVNDIMPFICVIPNESALSININTLKPESAKVLAAIVDISVEDARDIINARPSEGFKDIADLMNEPVLQNINNEQQSWLSVKSNYFMLDTKTRYNSATFKMSTLFEVSTKNGVKVISREFRSNH